MINHRPDITIQDSSLISPKAVFSLMPGNAFTRRKKILADKIEHFSFLHVPGRLLRRFFPLPLFCSMLRGENFRAQKSVESENKPGIHANGYLWFSIML